MIFTEPINLNHLCDDLLIEIFSYISFEKRVQAQLVCHRWLHLLRTSCAPRTLLIQHSLDTKNLGKHKICDDSMHVFTDRNTFKISNHLQLRNLNDLLAYQCSQMSALSICLTPKDYLLHLFRKRELIHALIHNCLRLQHLQLYFSGTIIDDQIFINLRPLLSRLSHLAIEYTQVNEGQAPQEQTWIETILLNANRLHTLFINLPGKNTCFPLNVPLPCGIRALHLPLCSFGFEQFWQLIDNGGDRLQQLSLYCITSDCLPLIAKEIPHLRKLCIGVRPEVLGNRESDAHKLKKLRPIQSLSLHRCCYDIRGAYKGEDAEKYSDQFNLTICEALANRPSVESLKLINLPLLRRSIQEQSSFTRAVQLHSPPANVSIRPTYRTLIDDLMSRYLERRLAIDALRTSPPQDIHEQLNMLANAHSSPRLSNLNDSGFEDTNSQLHPSMRALYIRLDEKHLDARFAHALDALLCSLCDLNQLRSLQIINLLDSFVNSINVWRLVNNCKHLQRLEIGTGKCITSDILFLFIERAQAYPKKRFLLKISDEVLMNQKIPSNLTLH